MNNEHRKCFNSPPQLLKIRTNDSGILSSSPPAPMVPQLLQASKLSALNLCVLPPQENEVTLEVSMKGEWMTFKDTVYMSLNFQKLSFLPYCCVCTSSSVEEEGWCVFLASGAISVKCDEKTYVFFFLFFCGHPQPCDKTLPLFYLTLYKTKMFRLQNRFEFSFLFFSFWSGADEKKISRKRLKGHCPETGEGPAVIRGRAWRSGSPPSGSQTHRSARQRCLHLDQWSDIILAPDTKQICQGTLEQSLSKQMPKWF